MNLGTRLAVPVGLIALVAGCSGSDVEDSASGGRTYHYITHANKTDKFWVTMQKGMEDAAELYNAKAVFFGNTGGDKAATVARQNQLVDEAVAQGVDGIAVTFNDISQQHQHIRAAVEAGVPVVAINVGYADAEEEANYPTGISAYVGQVETDAGAEAVYFADRRNRENGGQGLSRAVCVKGAVSQGWAVQRCEGFRSAVEELGLSEGESDSLGEMEYAILGGNFYADPPALPGSGVVGGEETGQLTIAEWLQANPTVDFIFSTAPAPLETILAARSSLSEHVVVGSVDVDNFTIDAIKQKACFFTIDQQQYLQGYLPIALLELEKDYLFRPASAATGPFFVTDDNVSEIEALVNAGTR